MPSTAPPRPLVGAILLALIVTFAPQVAAPARAATLPAGFSETVAFSGLTNPTVVRFSPDGRIFVAEKSGLIKIFDNLADATPTTFADLRTQVYNFWDRGLLGMALHPSFPTVPNVYVLYARDAAIGGTAPLYGTPGGTSDPCPTPPGAMGDGCVVGGRLSKLVASGNQAGPEQPLVEDWCQQYPSHSVGALQFGPDGALYVSSGDGASFAFADYGQDGSPVNPCGDPPGGAGATLTPPTAEGGALRSQDLRTTGDPMSLDGSILRLDPDTGAAMAGNPLIASGDTNTRRVIAHGLRNPFRFAFRPGTSEIYVGDVGWNVWEEINRIPNPSDATVENFGWPCYEGGARHPSYDAANLNICENLYAAGAGAITAPTFAYDHAAKVVSGETCPTGSSSISGVAFYAGGDYPASYDGGMFFADYSRDCIWFVPAGAGGQPNFSQRQTFVAEATNPVNLEIGPGGDLFYPDFDGGTIRRVRFDTGPGTGTYLSDMTPTSATNGWGPFERDRSNGEEGVADGGPITLGGITYAKGLGTHAASDIRYSLGGTCTSLTAQVGVDDEVGANGSVVFSVVGDGTTRYTSPALTGSSATVPINVPITGVNELQLVVAVGAGGDAYDHADWADARLACGGGGANQPPVPTIGAPASTLTWRVDDTIAFSGSGSDPEDGTLPGSALTWTLLMQHCPSTCHAHTIETFTGDSGTFQAPDHEYPSHLELRLTATDSAGLPASTSVALQPQTVNLSFATNPSGLQLAVGATTSTAPFQRTVIVGSANSISAPSPQSLGGSSYAFSAWSDTGAATHTITAPATPTTYTATFVAAPPATTTYLSDLTPTSATNGWGPYERDRSNGEQGAADGTTLRLNGVAYTKGLGTHAASDLRYTIPTGCTTFVADLGIDDEVTGTQGGVVFQVYRNTTLLYTSPQLNSVSATVPISLDVTGTGAGTLRLVAGVGNNGTAYDHADWAGARLLCGTGGADTTRPTVTANAPLAGATNVAADANATVTFNEAMAAGTISTATMSLVRQGTTTPVPGAVTYDGASRTATLNPTAGLDAGGIYTATVEGGTGGVADLAGNELAADHTWSFTVAAAPPAGLWGPPTDLAVGLEPHSVVAGRVNADATLDLVVGASGADTAAILRGLGDGTFQAPTTVATGDAPKWVALGDLNRDGRADMVSANQNADTIGRALGNGDGTFGPRVDLATCSRPHDVAVTDLNNDARADVVAACWNGSVISVHIGNGDGTFAPKVDYAAAANPHSLAVGDFNRDGRTDVAVANHGTAANSVSVLLGNGNGTLAAKVDYTTGGGPHAVRTADLNGDGLLDLVTANSRGNSVSVLLGNGSGTFGARTDFTAGSVPKAVAIADVNGDGAVDVLTANTAGNGEDASGIPDGDNVSVLLGNGAGSLGAQTKTTVGPTPFSLTVADLDADGRRDLVTANWHGDEAAVLRNIGATVRDTAPPGVTANAPVAGATGVAADANVTATFSEPVASVTGWNVQLLRSGTSTAVPAALTYDAASRTVTVNPTASLEGGATYIAIVRGGPGGVADPAGNALPADHAWSFTVAAAETTPPTVTATVPVNGATGVAGGANATATFSEPMAAGSMSTTTITLVRQGTTTPLPAAVTYDAATRAVTLNPNANLDPAVTYTATVRGGAGGVTDVAGNALAADHAWTFTVAGASDTTPPTVTGTVPTNGATGVAAGANLTATFSEPMAAGTISASTVTVIRQGTSTPLAAAVTYDATNRVATLNPNANLEAGVDVHRHRARAEPAA